MSAVVIENDFQNNWVELHPAEHPETLTAQELQTIVREAGIVGMGGATFPTQVKITPPKGKTIEKLVINGAECEPYLTADHRLMLEKPAEIIDGIHLMMLALDVKEAHVGVENNKMDAVEALRAAAKNVEGITIHDLPVRYPQGGEKQLVYALTRRKVPTGGLPLDVGCVVSNVGTVYAIQQAIREGRPLVQRVTTVGGLVNNPGNFLVSVGTPIDTLLEACGGMQSGARMLISGGPMMGMAITRTDIPVTKGTSGVLVLGEEAVDPVESACINCGRCLRACPMQLMPTLLDRCVRADRYDEAEKYGIMNCIECGTCTFVCPTCQCYDIKEFDSGRLVRRFRCWDSCMYSDFTKMSAGQPRPTQLERFRQRFMHKLVYFPDNNEGLFGCVGCGRCLAKCPIHMNIVKVIKTLGEEHA